MKEIYIVLTYTGTILSRIVKYYTRRTYSHVSIGLDDNLDRLYSFGRLHPYNAFVGGFVKENIHKGTFGRFKNTLSEVYQIQVTEEQYKRLEKAISKIEKQKAIYKFNILGLFLVTFQKRIKRANRFYCAEFVKFVLKKARITGAKDLPLIIKPEDFINLPNAKVVYQGYFREYDLHRIGTAA